MKRVLVGLLLMAGVAYGQQNASLQQKFQLGRAAYFRDVEGDRSADVLAHKEFDELMQTRPNDPVIVAYFGSLELLEAGRSWALWTKRTLARDGLAKLDEAVSMSPDDLEVRFIRGTSTGRLPFFFHRKQQSEADLSFVAPRAEEAARDGRLLPQIGAAALDAYGHLLLDRGDKQNARKAFAAAVRVDQNSTGGRDAAAQLKSHS